MKDYSLLIPYQKQTELQETMNFFKFIVPYEYHPKEIISTNVKGLGYARNRLLSRVTTPYVLYLDTGVFFDENFFDLYIKPAIDGKKTLIYKGNNNVLCTKIFGIQTITLKCLLKGFDNTFHIGEDLELGFAIGLNNFEYGMLKPEKTVFVPEYAVKHKQDSEYDYLDNLRVRVRLALRYKDKNILKIQRKKDFYGVFLIPYIEIYYWIKGNARSCYFDEKYPD